MSLPSIHYFRTPRTMGTSFTLLGRVVALSLAGILVVGLAGCGSTGFRPMYAASADGSGLGQKLAQVKITTIPGRVGQMIRNELLFHTRGGGEGLPPNYQLDIAVRETELKTLVNREGESLSRVYTLTASFQLIDLKTRKTLLRGESFGRAGYDRFQSIYANVRGQQDAKRRAAKTVAQDVKSRLEAYLAST